jgi:hypothetical protein
MPMFSQIYSKYNKKKCNMTSWSRGCETPNKMAASGSRFTPSYKLSKLFLTVHLVSRKSRASFRKPEQSVDRGASQAETAI